MVFSINGETGSLLRQGKGTLKSVSQGSPWNYLKSIIFNVLKWPSEAFHSMFLEWWNTKRILYYIWQTNSCLLNEGIPNIWKKLKSPDGLLYTICTCKIRQAGLAHWAVSFGPFSFLLFKMPSCLAIFSSSRHEKYCKCLKILFFIFYTSC